MAQELQSGTHRQDHDTRIRGIAEDRGLGPEIRGDDCHLDILPAVEQDDVEGGQVGALAEPDRDNFGGDPAPGRPALERHQVAAVARHVEQRGVEVRQAERPVELDHACQNLPTQPRRRISSRSSMVGE